MGEDLKVYSPSQLGKWSTCPRKWWWEYEQRLDRVGFKGIPRPVGHAVHIGVAKVWEGEDKATAVQASLDHYDKEWKTSLKEMTAEDIDKVTQGRWQVRACVEQYPYTKEGNVITHSQEEEIIVPMGRGRALRGFLDRRVELPTGMWVHDVKTSGLGLELIVKTMKTRQQFKSYWYLARAVGPEPVGLLLDLIIKPRVYVRKDGSVDAEKVKAQFHREPFYYTKDQLEEFERWFHWTVDRIDEARKEGWTPQNDTACGLFNRPCEFWELCARPSFEDATKATLYTVRPPREEKEVDE